MSTPSARPKSMDRPAVTMPTLGLLPILALSAVVSGPAQAQDSVEKDLGTIVLQTSREGEAATGYKVTESSNAKVLAPLLDTPKTIKVITRKEMKERGQTTVEDVLRATPGITLGTGEGGNPAGLNPVIRGNAASNDVLTDGFRSPLRTSYEAFNLESIEITKGPGGTAAGTGSTGGTINLTSKSPQDEDFADAALSFGTGAYKRGSLDLNRNYGDLGLRLNLMAQDAKSLAGRKGRESGRFGIAPSLRYTLSDSTKLTAGLYYFKDEDMQDYGVPLSTAAAGPLYRRGAGTAADPFLPVDVPTDAYYGLNARDFHDGETKSAFARVDHVFDNGLRWSSQLVFTDAKNSYVGSAASILGANNVTRSGRGSDREGESLQFNSQLTGKTVIGGMETRYAFGVDVSDTKNKNFAILATPALNSNVPTPIGNPNPHSAWIGSISRGALSSSTDTDTKAAYAFATIEVAPQWELSVGLRYDDFKTSAKNALGVETAQNDSRFWNGSFGVVYKPAENGSVYLSVATSANPGGEPNGVGGGPDSTLNALDPERGTSYELGTKWNLFDDRLFLSAAVFRTEKDNARATNALGQSENIGKSRAQGFEFDVQGQVTDQWQVSAGYSYIDAKILDGGFTSGKPSANNNTRVVGVPMHSISLWTTYDVSDSLTLGGGASYIGKRNLTPANTAMLPSQIRVDLMVNYKINETTGIQFNANNIFDEQLYVGNRGNGWVNVEPGRNFMLTLNHSF